MTTPASDGEIIRLKSCFIISPIGPTNTSERKHNDDVRDYIIKESVGPLGYEAVRADEIDEAGSITSQITQRLFEDDLVVADLTGHNPNVFYELAVRHLVNKPFVQIIQKDQTIPFDVQGMRLIFYDLSDPASVHSAKADITSQIRSWEGDTHPIVRTPISMPLEFLQLRQSGGADSSGLMDILPLIQRISSSTDEAREEIQQISKRVSITSGARIPVQVLHNRVSMAMGRDNPFAFIVFISLFEGRAPWLYELGREAYRQILVGNLRKGVELFHYMLESIGNMEERIGRGVAAYGEYVEELTSLFERFVSHTQSSDYEDSNLPF